MECIHAPTSMVVLRSLTGNKPAVRIQWSITAAESGQAQITLKLEAPIPFIIGSYKGFFSPGNVLSALRGVLAASGEGPAGEKIIEIVETEEGLFCSYRGTKYRMESTS